MVSDIESLVSSILHNLDKNLILKLQNWGKIVQLNIDGNPYFINFQDKLILKKGEVENSDFTIISSISTFRAIINGSNPVEAVVSGEVAIDGSLTSALEFSEILQDSDMVLEK